VGKGPLEGKRIIVTRPEAQAKPLADALERVGAKVFVVPLIGIETSEDVERLKASVRGVHRFEWLVVTSANAVTALREWSGFAWLVRTVRIAAVGPATAEAVRRLGVEPDFVPKRYAAEEIAAGLGPLDGVRVIVLRSDRASHRLERELAARGAHVQPFIAYRTVDVEPGPDGLAAIADDVDAIVLASGSAARRLKVLASRWDDVRDATERTLLVFIGPKTAAVATEVGLPVGLVAREATADGIIQALVSHYGENTG
jgi:uroporphyrinogen-III synthase